MALSATFRVYLAQGSRSTTDRQSDQAVVFPFGDANRGRSVLNETDMFVRAIGFDQDVLHREFDRLRIEDDQIEGFDRQAFNNKLRVLCRSSVAMTVSCGSEPALIPSSSRQ